MTTILDILSVLIKKISALKIKSYIYGGVVLTTYH